ncbi:phage tail length tape measure family protein [Orrella marina]|uniref:Bacteriophage tail tape measure N-terminal domain-containing protein n=1 Tax=Orrella marina TaxID=2163011 RepID=A0A2R4XF27_9BURK|nr:phage tail length tape measure family protein [Orrella marina]AWB32381.1 hypothetical protein DBV39_00155 [Orrella marina]
MASKKIGVILEGDDAGLRATLARSTAATKHFAQTTEAELNRAGGAAGAASTGMRTYSETLGGVGTSSRAASIAADRFIQDLQRQVDAIGKTTAELRMMRAAELGVADRAAPLIQRLDQASMSMGRAGISAGQYSMAMRQLPMQITDIVTSLASGMPIYMIAIQQGGQIRDSFGGMGAAMRGMLSIINPVTVGLGLMAAAGYGVYSAYSSAVERTKELNDALDVTGYQAGLTAAELSAMAASVAEVSGTQGKAISAIAGIISSNQSLGLSYQRATLAAIEWERATGTAVDETIKKFADMAGDPAKAIEDLDKQYNFLTANAYAQVQALLDQGRAQEAVSLASEQYYEAIMERAPRITEQTSWLARAWADVKDGTISAWEAFGVYLQGLVDPTITQQLEKLYEEAKDLEEEIAVLKQRNSQTAVGAYQVELRNLQYLLDEKQKEIKLVNDLQLADVSRASQLKKEFEEKQKLREIQDFLNQGRDAEINAMSDFERAQAQINDVVATYLALLKTVNLSEEQRVDLLDALNKQIHAIHSGLDRASSGTRRLGVATKSAAEEMREQLRNYEFETTLLSMTAAERERAIFLREMENKGIKEGSALWRELAQAQTSAMTDRQSVQSTQAQNREAERIFESLRTEEEAILDSYNRRREIILGNTVSTEQQKAEYLRRLDDETNQALLESSGSFWERYLAGAEEALTSFDEMSADVLQRFSQQFGDAFEAMVFDSQSLGDAVGNMAEGMARSVVNALGQMAAQWLAYQAVQMIVGKSTQQSGAAAMGANAAAMSLQAGLNAYAATAAIPIVGPAEAPLAMATALGTTGPLALAVAAAAQAGATGMAHDGIDSVPKTGTWLLEKGERVTTAKTSARLDGMLERIESGRSASRGDGAGASGLNLSVNLIEDASRAGQVSQRQTGDREYILDVMVADIMGGGRVAKTGIQHLGWKRHGT